MSIPIACTLDAAGAQARGDEWRAMVTRAVERVERASPTRFELILRPAFDDLDALAHLTQLEIQCCAFFRFAIEVTATNFLVAIEVPEEAAPVLQSFIDAITVGVR